MTAKEYLSQAYRLDQKINSKLKQIEQLRDLAQKVTVSYSSVSVSRTRNVTSMQDRIDQIIDSERELDQDIDLLIRLKKDIAHTIDQIHNDTYRLILEKRYLCYQSWAQIEADLKYTRRWVFTNHARALKVVEKLIANREVSA